MAQSCQCHQDCPEHAGRPCDNFVTLKKKARCSVCQLARDRRRPHPYDKECKHENCFQLVTNRRQALCNHHLHLKASASISSLPCNCARSGCDHPAGQCPNPRASKQAVCKACKCTEARARRNRRVLQLELRKWLPIGSPGWLTATRVQLLTQPCQVMSLEQSRQPSTWVKTSQNVTQAVLERHPQDI